MRTPEEELVARLQELDVKPTASLTRSPVEMEIKTEQGSPVSLRNLFSHHDTHPAVLDLALMKAFGMEWFSWEAETIWASIKHDFKADISELARSKIQTVKSIHMSALPWTSWQVFEKIIQGLNNNIPRFGIMQAPGLEQLYAGVDILNELRTEEFDDEVKLYMAAAVLHHDVCFVPAPLDFIQVELSQPVLRCRTCGNEDSALFHDGTCDTCAQKFHPDKNLDMDTHPDLKDGSPGKNLEMRLKFNPDPVQARWSQVATKPIVEVELEENSIDIQVGKLLLARDYMNLRRRQLAEQLTALKSWMGATQ